MGVLDIDDGQEFVFEHQSVSRRRNPIPLLLGVVALAAILITQWPRGSETTTEPTAPEVPTSSTTPDLVESEPLFAFPRISFITMPIGGGSAQLVPYSAPGEPTQLLKVSDIRLDRSGKWIAALGTQKDPVAPRLLFIGAVGRPLQSITSTALGFAWHDTNPGQIAFVEGDGTEPGSLRTIDLAIGTKDETEVTKTTGWIQHYGSWGFTTSISRINPWFTILSPSGAVVLEDQPGAVVGHIPAVGVVATLIGTGHYAIDPATAERRAIPALAGQEVLWNLEIGGTRGMIAMQTSGAGFRTHNVLIFNRLLELVDVLDSAPLGQAMTWSPDGSQLVFTVDDFSERTRVVVYDAAEGTTLEASYPEVGGHRNRAILVD